MSLETHISGSEDALIAGLAFSGRNTASYITERREVSFAPQTSANIRPSGSRLLRFSLADQQGFLMGDTVRLAFKITNLSPTGPLVPITDSPLSMFRRMRVIANGSAVIEDVEELGRCCQIFSELLPSSRRYNNMAEHWGGAAVQSTLDNPAVAEAIPADSERTVVITLMSSFLSQGKMIPLSMVPVIIELEIGEVDDAFAGNGNNWEITRPRLLASVCTLETSLMNSYAQHLLSGKSLPLTMTGMYSVKTSVPAGASLFSFPIARGFTRLSAIYVTFHDGAGKFVNRFYSPLEGQANITVNDDLEWGISIGSEKYPVFNIDSHQESFYRLRMTQLIHAGSDSVSISPVAYRSNKFIGAMSLEKAPGASSHSGVNTRSGSQLTINFRNLGNTTTAHCILVFDQVCNISAAGVECLD
jgi:hypothetical protein